MSRQLAAAEPYTTRFETAVSGVDGRAVTLEQTYFYAESGGQPADTGTIGSIPVEDVKLVAGEHVHLLAREPTFSVGHRVMCAIDWTFRMYCMRAHTASHVLYGGARRLLEEPAYAGFDIGERTVRVDLETTTAVDDELLVELEALINTQVWESQPVSWTEIPHPVAHSREEVVFNTQGEDGATQPTGSDEGATPVADADADRRVRVVTIGEEPKPWDVAACGGTHVRNTREIGPVTLLERSNPGAGRTRIEFAVGEEGIARRAAEKRAAYKAQQQLGVPLEAVPDALEATVADRETLASTVQTLRRELVTERIQGAEPIERAGSTWLVAVVEDVEPTVLEEVAETVVEEHKIDAVGLIGKETHPFAVVCVDSGDLSAAAIIDSIVETFGGGGGGSDRLAQGGGFEVTATTLSDWFRSS